MPWRFWIVDLPAKAVSIWFTVYWLILSVACVVMLATLTASMLLAAFGVRWGW